MNCESFELFSQTSFNYSFFSEYKQHTEQVTEWDHLWLQSYLCMCCCDIFITNYDSDCITFNRFLIKYVCF